MQTRRQRCPTLPDLLSSGTSQQVRERQLSVLAAPGIHDVFDDERTQSQTFIQLAHQSRPLSEVTREPWKSTFKDGLNESWKG
jgi:hypothetical protein